MLSIFFVPAFFFSPLQVRFDDALKIDVTSTQFPVLDPVEDAYHSEPPNSFFFFSFFFPFFFFFFFFGLPCPSSRPLCP